MSFEQLAATLVDGESRDITMGGEFVGRLALYRGKWYVGGPQISRENHVAICISLGPDIFNKRERNHLKHYYKCDTVEDATATFEGLLAYEE